MRSEGESRVAGLGWEAVCLPAKPINWPLRGRERKRRLLTYRTLKDTAPLPPRRPRKRLGDSGGCGEECREKEGGRRGGKEVKERDQRFRMREEREEVRFYAAL